MYYLLAIVEKTLYCTEEIDGLIVLQL